MAFTPITGGLDWQAVDFCNEFRNALSERRQTIGGAELLDIEAGEDIQAVTFWKTFQDWLEDNCTSFVDENATIAGESAVPMWTETTWQAEAGIHANGFRRAKVWDPDGGDDWTDNTDAMFGTTGTHDGGYGVMQAGDIIGPWVFDDLQKGFGALNWTTKYTSGSTDYESRKRENDRSLVCTISRAAHIAGWVFASWVTGTSTKVYEALAVGNLNSGFSTFHSYRQKGKPYISGISTLLNHAMDMYLLPSGPGGFDAFEFDDIDGLTMSEDALILYQQFTIASASSRTGDLLNPSNDSPVEDMPLNCALASGYKRWGVTVWGAHGVLKWSFSET